VRLATCIALELAVAAGAVGGVWLGVSRVAHVAFHGQVAAAAPSPDPSDMMLPTLVEPLAPARLPIAAPFVATVFGAPDDDLLAPLGATPLARVKLNHGGTSLSLRLEFASGARGAFKPQQVHPQSDPKREIAAYRIDRMLGIGHVAPAKSIALSIDELVGGVDPGGRPYTQQRLAEEATIRDGQVRGVVSWWIPEIIDLKFHGAKLDEADGMAAWTALLQHGVKIPDGDRALVAQLSACVLFDVLIDNADRWSGSNTKGSPDGKTLYFMDNTLAFQPYTVGHESNVGVLHRIEVFSRSLVGKLRALSYASLVATLAGSDPGGLAPLLTPLEIRAILARRDNAVRYIDMLIEQFGVDAILALP